MALDMHPWCILLFIIILLHVDTSCSMDITSTVATTQCFQQIPSANICLATLVLDTDIAVDLIWTNMHTALLLWSLDGENKMLVCTL